MRTHDDLLRLFCRVNRRYFAGALIARVEWMRRGRKRKPDSAVTLGYCQSLPNGTSLIRIHHELRQPWVPRWTLEALLLHECLHIIHPPAQIGKRMEYHHSCFKESEAKYSILERFEYWWQRNKHKF